MKARNIALSVVVGIVAGLLFAAVFVVADPVSPDPEPTSCLTKKVYCEDRVE